MATSKVTGTTATIDAPSIADATPTAPPWYIAFAINNGILVLHQVLHNPHQAAYLKATLLQLRDSISAAYPGE